MVAALIFLRPYLLSHFNFALLITYYLVLNRLDNVPPDIRMYRPKHAEHRDGLVCTLTDVPNYRRKLEAPDLAVKIETT